MIAGTGTGVVGNEKSSRCVRAFVYWLLPGLCCSLLFGCVGLAINLLDDFLQQQRFRLMPELSLIADVAMVLALLSVPVFAYKMAGAIPRSLLAMRRFKRRAIVGTGLAIQTGVAVGCALLVMVSDPDWFFGDTCIDSQPVSSGHTMYLYRGGLFCSYTVYRRDPWDPVLRPVKSIPRERCLGQVVLVVHDGRNIEIAGADGRPLAAQPVDFSALYLGPH